MAPTRPAQAPAYDTLTDSALVALAQRGQRDAFRAIMQRCNQRLFRVARAVTGDDSEAEDVVQEAYTCAFDKLDGFRGDASLLTWLTAIVLNEARGRLRQRRNTVEVGELERSQEAGRVLQFPSRYGSEDPAAGLARAQFRHLLEQAIDQLPEPFRIVFVLREIEECTVEETATQLELRPETIKTRLHRARRLLRTALQASFAANLGDAFPFLGRRCDRITEIVLARMAAKFVATP